MTGHGGEVPQQAARGDSLNSQKPVCHQAQVHGLSTAVCWMNICRKEQRQRESRQHASQTVQSRVFLHVNPSCHADSRAVLHATCCMGRADQQTTPGIGAQVGGRIHPRQTGRLQQRLLTAYAGVQ